MPRPHLLEMRPVADDAYAKAEVRFDLKEEQRRLREWLANRQMRLLVVNDPAKIDVFNKLSSHKGGPLSPYLRWCPHVIRPSRSNRKRWSASFRYPNHPIVPVYDEWTYSNGVDGSVGQLVELVGVNTHAPCFTSADVDLDTLVLHHTEELNGQLLLQYSLKEDRLEAYASWTKDLVGRSIAEIVDGEVVEVPYFRSAVSGTRLRLVLPFTEKESRQLILRLKLERETGRERRRQGSSNPLGRSSD